jgi:ubiquinone/menaquinone biosynthesis C-methylase UbiE
VEFWSGFAGRYDGHIASREALVLVPRIAAAVGSCRHVLDLGCGTGDVALALAGSAERVSAVDFAAGMIEVARRKASERGIENVDFSVQAASSLPFPDGSFDAVIMANVLHVMENPDLGLREAARVLRQGGLLIAPTYCHGQSLRARLLSWLSGLLFGLRIHNRWSDDQALDRIGQAGFLVKQREIARFRMPLVHVEAIRT